MASFDQYRTPEALASWLVGLAGQFPKNPRVADPAAGDGSLLSVAEGAFAPFSVTGIEIDPVVARACASVAKHWKVINDDFFAYYRRAAGLGGPVERFDIVVANPPFSCRGGTRVWVQIGDAVVPCSVAMAFILSAARLLSPPGLLLALVPNGMLTSHRDEYARAVLENAGSIETYEVPAGRHFAGASARLSAVVFRKSRALAVQHEIPVVTNGHTGVIALQVNGWRVSIKRGRTPNRRALPHEGDRFVPFLHSTDLRGGQVTSSRQTSLETARRVESPSVLIPRVGKPSVHKVAVLHDVPAELSDCVIALECHSLRAAEELAAQIRCSWGSLASLYSGSGAPFLRVSDLQQFIRSIAVPAPGQR